MTFNELVERSLRQAVRYVMKEESTVQLLASSKLYLRLQLNEDFSNCDEFRTLARQFSESFPNIDDLDERAALIAAIAKAEQKRNNLSGKVGGGELEEAA